VKCPINAFVIIGVLIQLFIRQKTDREAKTTTENGPYIYSKIYAEKCKNYD